MISPSVSYIFSDWTNISMNWFSNIITAMDIPTIIICGGVFVISAVVMYLISAFGIRERTYEEAMEEQRRRNQEAVQHSKNDKSKKDKRYKKWSKRSKEKSEEERCQGGDLENKAVSDDTKIKEDSGSNSSSQNHELKVSVKKKNRQRKAMMLNKEDHSQQLSSSDETDEPPSASSSPDIPKATKEELKSLQTEKAIKSKEEGKTTNLESQQELQEKTEISDSSKHTSLKKSPLRKKKNRNEYMDSGSDFSESNETKLLNIIKMTVLNEEELLRIIDVLSSRLKNHEKRKNEIQLLKKLLQEKEDALRTEQKASHASNEKVNDLLQDLSEAKAQATTVEKSLRSALNQEQQEIKGLHDMMQRKQKHYTDEIAAMQSKMKKMKNIMKDEHALAIQRLQDENNQLQSLNRMESEKSQRSSLEISRLQHEIDQLRSSREKFESHQNAMQQSQEDLRHQIQQLEQIISSHQEEDYSYKQRINEMSNKIQQAENARSSLVQELQNAETVCSSLEADNSSLRQRLEEIKHQLNSSEQNILTLQNSLEESNRQQRDLANCLEEQLQITASIKQENEMLLTQVEQLKQKLSENSSQSNTTEQIKLIDSEENETVLKKDENLVPQLMEELSQCNIKKDNLMNELTTEKKKYEELNVKHNDLTKALQLSQAKIQEVIQSAELKVREAQLKVDNNSKEMQDLLNEQIKEVELALRESFTKELQNAHKETETVKKQADERVLKCESQANVRLEEFQESLYKRLNQLNSDAEAKIEEAVKEKEQIQSDWDSLKSSLKEFIRRVFPNIDVPKNVDDITFWNNCQKQIESYIEELRLEQPQDLTDTESMTKDLEEKSKEKKNLENKIKIYENVLCETESILKNLQNNVESEEEKWKTEMQSKEEALEKIKSENEGLKVENENLRISLEQLQELRESLYEIEELRIKLHKEEEDKKILQEKIRMIDNVAKNSPCPITENNILEISESNILPNKSEKKKKTRKRGGSGKK